MKKYFFSLVLLYYVYPLSYGQNNEGVKGFFYIAPDFGLMFGTINRIEISPAIGYHITDRFSVAGGFNYEFYSQTRQYSYQESIKTQIYGPRVFTRYTMFNNLGDFLPIGINTALFAHVEFEANSLESKYFAIQSNSISKRFWYNTVLIGGGISQSASERVNLNFIVLWDTDGSSVSPHSNPIIRIGFQFFLRSKLQEF